MQRNDPGDLAERVYGLLCRIPRGRVVTYGELARAAQCKSARAIGQVLRRNPHAPQVPCHRVIRSDLTLGGYSGSLDGAMAARKLQLLRAEGVCFAQGRLRDPAHVWHFPVSVAERREG